MCSARVAPGLSRSRRRGAFALTQPAALDSFAVRRPLLVGMLVLALAGCGGGAKAPAPSATATATPPVSQSGTETPAGPPLGFPVVATKNTTRIAGADPIADAAGAALATYPARTPESRPAAVILADVNDWHTGIAASVLVGRPIDAPLLFAQGDKLPPATSAALDALQPTGAKQAGGAQVIRVGTTAPVAGYKTADVAPGNPAAVAAAVDRLRAAAAGASAPAVVVAPLDHPEYAMPAAGWAAKSGDPVLWAGADALPQPTVAALKTHGKPGIFVLGASALSAPTLKRLGRFGKVTRIPGSDPVTAAIDFARYHDGPFGWGVTDPGHGLVFANTRYPQDAAAAAPLSATGTYGPLLVLTDAGVLPKPLQDFLLDIQPGYNTDPVRGVYSHGWMIGDENSVSAAVQARIDTLLEIQPVDTKGE
jgi:hypothetical protein